MPHLPDQDIIHHNMNTTPSECIELCRQVISEAMSLKRHKLESKLESYAEVLQTTVPEWNEFVREQKERNQNHGHLFNPLTFFKIGETKHSFLLRYLLDPNASHGQGNLFLHSFLDEIGIPPSTEGQGGWVVPPCEHMNIDILLFREHPASVVIIENKSHDAVDQPNQLYRYWLKAIYDKHRDLPYDAPETRENFKVIYLPSGDHKRYTEQSITRPDKADIESYKDEYNNLPKKLPLPITTLTFKSFICKWLEKITTSVPKQNTRLRTYLEFYKELCQSL